MAEDNIRKASEKSKSDHQYFYLCFVTLVLDYRQNLGLLSSRKTLTRPIDKIVKFPQLNFLKNEIKISLGDP